VFPWYHPLRCCYGGKDCLVGGSAGPGKRRLMMVVVVGGKTWNKEKMRR
jgi:hypothetical protein